MNVKGLLKGKTQTSNSEREKMIKNSSDHPIIKCFRSSHQFSPLEVRIPPHPSLTEYNFPFKGVTQTYLTTDISQLTKEACTEAVETPKETTNTIKHSKLTIISLHSNKILPGLGPENIEYQHLIKKDVGLAEPIITRDYPSPEGENLR